MLLEQEEVEEVEENAGSDAADQSFLTDPELEAEEPTQDNLSNMSASSSQYSTGRSPVTQDDEAKRKAHMSLSPQKKRHSKQNVSPSGGQR